MFGAEESYVKSQVFEIHVLGYGSGIWDNLSAFLIRAWDLIRINVSTCHKGLFEKV